MVKRPFDIHCHWNSASPGKLPSLVPHCRSQPGIIEHRWPQSHRELANSSHCVLSQLLGIFKVLFEFLATTASQLFKIPELNAERRKGLANFVVEFTRY